MACLFGAVASATAFDSGAGGQQPAVGPDAPGCRLPGNRLRPDEPGTGGPEVLALEELGMELRLGPGYLDGLEADVVFRTRHAPGHPALQALRARARW